MTLTAIDIGNTSITFGLFRSTSLIRSFNIQSSGYSLVKLKAKISAKMLRDTVICSVVPDLTRRLSRDLRALSGKEPLVIGKDIKVPIRNLYRKPRQVGQDRLVNAYAALGIYGAPVVVVDFGTAITFDVISRKEEYLGGMILPGIKISLEALNQRTALLPKVRPDIPNDFIGRDTKNSMLSGVIYGFSSLTDELITRIRKAVGKDTRAVATGGNANLISKYCRRLNEVNTNLTLKGLSMLYFNKKNT